MNRSGQSRTGYSKLPRDVEDELSAVHLEKTWALLAEKFCFNVGAWKKEFEAYRQRKPGRISRQQAFVDFGAEYINPVLNSVLKRGRYHPTWTNLLKYIVEKH